MGPKKGYGSRVHGFDKLGNASSLCMCTVGFRRSALCKVALYVGLAMRFCKILTS